MNLSKVIQGKRQVALAALSIKMRGMRTRGPGGHLLDANWGFRAMGNGGLMCYGG